MEKSANECPKHLGVMHDEIPGEIREKISEFSEGIPGGIPEEIFAGTQIRNMSEKETSPKKSLEGNLQKSGRDPRKKNYHSWLNFY